jgi:hypothetical protein
MMNTRRRRPPKTASMTSGRPAPARARMGGGVSWEPMLRAVAAATFLLVHTVIATTFIVCMYGFESLIKYLWGVHEPLLFGRMPLAYVFDAIDLGVLGVFGYRGVLAAYKAFEE